MKTVREKVYLSNKNYVKCKNSDYQQENDMVHKKKKDQIFIHVHVPAVRRKI